MKVLNIKALYDFDGYVVDKISCQKMGAQGDLGVTTAVQIGCDLDIMCQREDYRELVFTDVPSVLNS